MLSRGPQGCDSSVYGDVASNRDLVVRAAVAAAQRGGYPLPSWAQPYAPADLGPDQVHIALKNSIETMEKAQHCALLWFGEILRR